MRPEAIAELCQLLSQQDRWPEAIEQLRTLTGASALRLEVGTPPPAPSTTTQWSQPLVWEGFTLGRLDGEGPRNPDALAITTPLLAWSLARAREHAQNEERMSEVQVRAARALDLSELVTWLLHARDEQEVERLGSTAVTSVLRVDIGAMLLRERNGSWVLRIPDGESVPIAQLGNSRYQLLLNREHVELECTISPEDGPVDWVLWHWGYRHAFAVALDSGEEPLGILFALSKQHKHIDAEARVAAAQLSIMISVAIERLRDQRGLAEHRKSLEDALRIASMGTWELELKTLQVTWSRELHQLYGGPFTPRQLSHDEVLTSLVPGDRERYEAHLRTLLAEGTAGALQVQLETPFGKKLFVRMLFELLTDPQGLPERVHCVTRDVSAEVLSQLEREVALARASKYEQLYLLSDTLALVVNDTGIIEEASPSWSRQLGYGKLELLGVEFVSLVHDDDARLVREVLERIRAGTASGTICRVRAKSGDWRWISWTSAYEAGRFYAAASDVTSLEETSERLRRSEEQLKQAGAMARIGAWELDPVTEVIAWSDEVAHLFGVSDDFKPTFPKLVDFYSPAMHEQLVTAVRGCIDQGMPYDLELEVITASGERIWARHQGQSELVNGRTLRIFGAFQDVTEQRRAREEAIAASRVKSQFLANTSHEIRTPLNGILGMTQLALETSLEPDQREYLEAVKISGQNLLAIVNDILDISKIESGRLELERVPFSFAQTVANAVRGQASRAHARDLELVLDLNPSMPDQMLGDPVRVGQVVTNLVGNSVKFTERGEVTVSVTVEAGNTVHLVVSDTGIGIPPDRIDAIFEAFTQADGSTNRRFGGTGLGLTITLELVKAMGGRIEVESTPNVGSRFHVFIPAVWVDGEPRLAPPRNNLRALVISATAAAKAATVRQLNWMGYDATSAGPQEAMKVLLDANPPFNALIVDQELGSTSGTELCEALEQHDGLNKTARVLLTRTTSRPTPEELTRAGIRRVATRPIFGPELKQALGSLRSSGSSAGSGALPVIARAPRRSLKVLLAEDNAINARLAQRLLERLGHQVVHVADGERAVEAVQRESWDAVLMDMQMPILDGLDATRRIRLEEGATGSHLPIIALTANAMKGDEVVCLEAGMDAYLTKPIDLDRLSAVLDAIPAAPVRGMSA